MDEVILMAKEVTLKDGHHSPMILAQAGTEVVPMIFSEFPDEHEEKLAYLFRAGKMLKKDHPLGQLQTVFFISEGWMVKLSKAEAKERAFPRASEDSRRVEVLFVAKLDCASKKLEMEILEFERGVDGKLIALKDFDLGMPGIEVRSPFPAAFVTGYEME